MYNAQLTIKKFKTTKTPKQLFLILVFLLLFPAMGFCSNDPSKSKAVLHPLIHNGPLTNPYESLVFGNGDVAVSAQMFTHQLTLQIGKNDIFDSRSSNVTKEQILTQDKLIEINGKADGMFDYNRAWGTNFTGGSKQGPSPKPAGQIIIYHPGLSNKTTVSGKVDVSTGIFTVEYGFPEGTLFIEVFVHKEKNLVLSKYSVKGKVPWFKIIVEKKPDYVDDEIPLPVISGGRNNRQHAISQTIKAKYGVPDFSWYLGCLFPEQATGVQVSNILKWRYALEQRLTLADNTSVVMAVGVATDRDGKGSSLERALDLSEVAGQARYEEEKLSHINGWNKFWSASSIEIEDKELEALWYRTMFGFACHLNPKAQAPGLNANIPMFDFSAWNGNYTWNHNVQKWYFPALAVNHPEWYYTLARLLDQHIPVFEHLAKEVFGLEGIYIDLYTFPFTPAEHALSYYTFGRALSHTGWFSQMLYQHYEFTNDVEWLREHAYTFLWKAADFYANYLDKYQGKDNVIFPSMLLEDTGRWEEGFPEGKNVLTDLIYFKKAFESAIHASELLNTDAKKRERWKRMLKRVPAVEYGWKDGRGWFGIYKDWQKVWPDFDKYINHLQTSRWGNSGWLVFPGEYIEGDEKTGLAPAVRDALAGTDLLNLPARTREHGTFHGEANFLPFMRMGMMEKYDDLRTLLMYHRFASGQFSPFATGENVFNRGSHQFSWRIVENQYFPILGITEMLLQSQGSVIRLFPYWPMQKSASFDGLRARGGFLVSASWNPDEGMKGKIKSLSGNQCTIRWERDTLPVIKLNGKPVAFTKKGRDIVFKTLRDAEYELTLTVTSEEQNREGRQKVIKWANPIISDKGVLGHHIMQSKALGNEVGYNVWLPGEYFQDTKKRFPVIYFLHGLGGNETSDAASFSRMVSKAIRNGLIPPVICVFPNGGTSLYLGEVEKMIINELIPTIDNTYRTIAKPQSRALSGFSMGGYGSVMFSVNYPEMFCAMGSMGGGLFRIGETFGQDVQKAIPVWKKNGYGFFFVNGDKDRPDAFKEFIETLNMNGVNNQQMTIPDTDHSLSRYYDLSSAQLLEFIGNHIKTEP